MIHFYTFFNIQVFKMLSSLQLMKRTITIIKISFLNGRRSSFCMWEYWPVWNHPTLIQFLLPVCFQSQGELGSYSEKGHSKTQNFHLGLLEKNCIFAFFTTNNFRTRLFLNKKNIASITTTCICPILTPKSIFIPGVSQSCSQLYPS